MAGIFRQIFVSAKRELAPFGTVFVFDPENFDQKKLGTLFGIIKISDTSQESSYVANLLTSVIKKEYFSKPDRPAETSFEAALRKANIALAELARRGSVKWTGEINFVAGALEKNNLHFSRLGTTFILLLRGGMIADIGAGMETEAEEPSSHPLKTFSDISSGKLETGDCLILTTADLLEIFSLEEIRQNAALFSRDEFPNILSASLTANSELSGAIVVNLVSEEEIATLPQKEEMSLPLPQKQPAPATAVPLSKTAVRPAGAPHMDIPRAALFAGQKTEPGKEKRIFISESDEITLPARGIKALPKKFLSGATSATNHTKNGLRAVGKKTFHFFGSIDWRKLFFAARSVAIHIVQFVRGIDWRKKSSQIWTASALAVVLVATLFSLYRNLNKEPASSVTPAAQPQPAAATLDDINVENIENIADIATLPADSRELMFLGDSLFVLSGDKSVLKINPSDGATEKSDSNITGGKFQLAAAMPDLNTIFLLTADKKIISFTPSNKKFTENSVSLPTNLNATDIKTYLTYIYFLDSAANQIYRYPRAEGGFGEQQVWLKTGSDVKSATSFAINEDLFVAARNQIAAYLQGKKDEKVNFENPTVPLAADKIFTDPDLEKIYILDNKNHRIVAYSKDGRIAAQYWNTSITGVKDFAADEKNKIIYLQKADSILKFSTE